MNITASQKKALQAAGYTVKGDSVSTKDGKSIGGYNKNGNIWSGSSKVRDILKGSPKESPKTAPKPSAKAVPKKKEAPVTKDGMKGYRKGDVETSKIPAKTGSGKDIRKTVLSALDKADAKKKEKKSGSTIPALGVAATVASKARTKPAGKPHNPAYKGANSGKNGFQGKYQTGVGFAGGEGRGKRKLGYAPTLGVGGSVGRPSLDDKLGKKKLM